MVFLLSGIKKRIEAYLKRKKERDADMRDAFRWLRNVDQTEGRRTSIAEMHQDILLAQQQYFNGNMTYFQYVDNALMIMRQNVHDIAVPFLRALERTNWRAGQAIFAFNEMCDRYDRNKAILGRPTTLDIEAMSVGSLDLLSYAWGEKDVSIQNVFVMINPGGTIPQMPPPDREASIDLPGIARGEQEKKNAA